MSRFYRTTREAFPCERFNTVEGPYRRTGWLVEFLQAAFCLSLFALLGVLIAWRF